MNVLDVTISQNLRFAIYEFTAMVYIILDTDISNKQKTRIHAMSYLSSKLSSP